MKKNPRLIRSASRSMYRRREKKDLIFRRCRLPNAHVCFYQMSRVNWTSCPNSSLRIPDDTGGEPGGPGGGGLVHVETSGYCFGPVSTLSHVYFTFCLLFFPHISELRTFQFLLSFISEMTCVHFRTDFQLKFFFPCRYFNESYFITLFFF